MIRLKYFPHEELGTFEILADGLLVYASTDPEEIARVLATRFSADTPRSLVSAAERFGSVRVYDRTSAEQA